MVPLIFTVPPLIKGIYQKLIIEVEEQS
jgi:hypothetical protein